MAPRSVTKSKRRGGNIRDPQKEDLDTAHIIYQSDNVVLATEKHHKSFVDIFFPFPSSSLISSNLPAQPLRQQHFCMEQQLKHLCEGRPFDVLCVDNAQKCSTQAGSEKGAGERLHQGVGERQRERERERERQRQL